MFQRYGYILPINEKWWNRFCNRNREGKTLQTHVRRGKVGPKNAQLLLFYVTHPFKEIRGFGEFVDRITGDANDLWKTHGRETCLTHNEYSSFMQGRQNATFIFFRSLHELLTPVPIDTITKIIGINRMLQTGKYITREETYKILRT